MPRMRDWGGIVTCAGLRTEHRVKASSWAVAAQRIIKEYMRYHPKKPAPVSIDVHIVPIFRAKTIGDTRHYVREPASYPDEFMSGENR
jgi:hypothetical protein